MHGFRYIQFIGDGDSSVYPTLIQRVPGWGHAIRKLECANHACKCYKGALERLVQDNPSYKGNGGLTMKMRRRLVNAARCAIKMRSCEKDRQLAESMLKRDLTNGPNHCFGNHDNCSPDFCTTARERLSRDDSHQAQDTPEPVEDIDDDNDDILGEFISHNLKRTKWQLYIVHNNSCCELLFV